MMCGSIFFVYPYSQFCPVFVTIVWCAKILADVAFLLTMSFSVKTEGVTRVSK